MSNVPARRSTKGKSLMSIVDDGILVVVAVIGALVVLKLLGVIAGAVWFMIKVAALAGLVYVVLRALRSRAR